MNSDFDVGKTFFHLLFGGLLWAVLALPSLLYVSRLEYGCIVGAGAVLVAFLGDRFWENPRFWTWFRYRSAPCGPGVLRPGITVPGQAPVAKCRLQPARNRSS